MSDDFIPTRASLAKKNACKEVEVVTFESYKPKEKKENDKKYAIYEDDFNGEEFNIKQAKHEVMQFGMSGFTSKRKEAAKLQLAIKLGAKPPKSKYKNYKELLVEKKREKNRESKVNKFQQLGKNSVGKSIAKGKSFDRKRKKGKDGILDIYGKVTKVSKKN
ncbi:unnamed protein product [Brassicogethes aeneus]|uniref:Uncharacterized protein n=1 Tax=Brassicogethes aeneus TaxID=1431903 RepID=A0A9P0AZS8_BRAAE|nr:unnamed protein product [Brassicogethes aeneus]